MFSRWTCYRCDQTFRNVRLMRAHICPAANIAGRTALDDARRRDTRERDRRYRATGRRERVIYV